MARIHRTQVKRADRGPYGIATRCSLLAGSTKEADQASLSQGFIESEFRGRGSAWTSSEVSSRIALAGSPPA